MGKRIAVLSALAAAAVVAAAALAPVAEAATPATGAVSVKSPSTTWSGGPFTASNPGKCAGPVDPTCDHFTLTVHAAGETAVRVAITAEQGNDFDLFVYDAVGNPVTSSSTGSGNESVVIPVPASGTYEIRVQPWLVVPGATYSGVAQLDHGNHMPAVDAERDCLAGTPGAFGVSGVTDAGQTVDLDVTVLLDGVDLTLAERVMGRAADSYTPLGIDLDVVRYRTVEFTGDDAYALIQQAKDRYDGYRPRGSDLVYVLTSKDIQADGNTGVAGLADCIGGVRYPERAFAVGEVFPFENLVFGPFTFYADATAKIAAHELGHLMGAHHHYANCAEAATLENVQTVSPCTVMFNFVDFQAINFSTVNRAVVRGHAVDFASP